MDFDDEHNKILDCAKDLILNSFSEILAIYIFGSFGSIYETKDSDIDLAILPTADINSVQLWNLSQTIAIKVNCDVDIIDLKTASTVFRNQIITTGTRIYCANEFQCNYTENLYQTMYLNFNEERKGILEDIEDDKWTK